MSSNARPSMGHYNRAVTLSDLSLGGIAYTQSNSVFFSIFSPADGGSCPPCPAGSGQWSGVLCDVLSPLITRPASIDSVSSGGSHPVRTMAEEGRGSLGR